MQVRNVSSKGKYRIKEFASAGNANENSAEIKPNETSVKLYCICGNYTKQKEKVCFRCKSSYDICVTINSKLIQEWECPRCVNKYMDPINTVGKVLIETHYKTENVYENANRIQFHFYLEEEELKRPVQVRGLKDGKENLYWPMQGQFYLGNIDKTQPIFELKPLLLNSNRKNRKSQPFVLPSEKLRTGWNILTFWIPRLDANKFKSKYQCEQREVYFIGIYSINVLRKEELISKTLKQSVIQKPESIKLFKKVTQNSDDPDLSISKVKLSLECPYTRQKIKIPVRGKKCQHYMCICLRTLIEARGGMGSREWLCPLCNKKINQPVVDIFLLDILTDGTEGRQIFLDGSGKYQWLPYQKSVDQSDSQSIQRKPKPVTPPKKEKQKVVMEVQGLKTPKPLPPTIQDKGKKPSQREPIRLDDDDDLIQIIENPVSIDPKAERQKRRQLEKKQQREAILNFKENKKKKKVEANISHPKKDDFMIKDVKQIEFRSMTTSEFTKKYFRIDYNRGKIPEDLQLIFREVL